MRIAIVDFDGTLFQAETIPFLLKRYRESAHINVIGKARYYLLMVRLLVILIFHRVKLGALADKEVFRRRATTMFLTLFHRQPRAVIQMFFTEAAKQMGQRINRGLVEELKALQRQGYRLVLLSGCFLPLLEQVPLGIQFDVLFATQLKIDPLFDASQPLMILSGSNKQIALEQLEGYHQVDWSESCAYADAYYDTPILELVGRPVAVNPDPGLAKIASARDWRIYKG